MYIMVWNGSVMVTGVRHVVKRSQVWLPVVTVMHWPSASCSHTCASCHHAV